MRLDVTELVPGDVVELRLGAIVPADVRLLEAVDLGCDEAVLTGESVPVGKDVASVPPDPDLADLVSCAFMGTVVQAGESLGVVVATGTDARFGGLAAELGEQQPPRAGGRCSCRCRGRGWRRPTVDHEGGPGVGSRTLRAGGRASPCRPAARVSAGNRVVAVATRDATGLTGIRPEDERGLELRGFLVFLNPPNASARAALERLDRLGVRVKVLTGDNAAVAGTVCGQLGLPAGETLTGADLDQMDDDASRERIGATAVFARVSPERKARMVRAERGARYAVGFLGDGVNDAVALLAADVGASVTPPPTSRRRGRDPSAEEPRGRGRRRRGRSSDLQLAIPTDNVEDPEHLERPTRWDVSSIRRFMLVPGPISSVFDFLTFAVMLGVFHAGPARFRSGWFVESLTNRRPGMRVVCACLHVEEVPAHHHEVDGLEHQGERQAEPSWTHLPRGPLHQAAAALPPVAGAAARARRTGTIPVVT